MRPPFRTLRFLIGIMVLLLPGALWSAPQSTGIPEPLKPWIDWVLHAHEDRLCPMEHDNAEARHCQWPGQLNLRIDDSSGRFTLKTRSLLAGWHPLPGDPKHWPLQVRVNDKPAIVTARDQLPGVHLTPGNHLISGQFTHATLPEFLPVPKEIGQIVLNVSGKPRPFATPDPQGRLWMQPQNLEPGGGDAQSSPPRDTDQLEVNVHRLLRDEVPVHLETRIELRVAGRPRDIVLPNSLSERWIPIKVESQLPLRLEPDGALTIQAKPGVWHIELDQRLSGPLERLERPRARTLPWPEEEIWAFAANHRLRIATLTGLAPVDPRQTGMPAGWRDYPTFRFLPGERATIKVSRSGEIDPSPERLTLTRHIWLDFSGAGWTIQDRIQGKGSGSWRLEMRGPTALGRVEIGGENQFITRLPKSTWSGVEVRNRHVELIAESRLPLSTAQAHAAPDGTQAAMHGGVGSSLHTRLPAVGWDLDFQQVTGTLHLPPGWRLLHATGMDDIGESWLGRWSLLDLFLTLVTALAAARLWGRNWGGLTLLALALIHPEEKSLAWNLLFLMAVVAVLRFVPGSGWAVRGIKFLRLIAQVSLVLLLLPFLVQQARQGLYPQLERAWLAQPVGEGSPPPSTAPRPASEPKSLATTSAPPSTTIEQAQPAPTAAVQPEMPMDARTHQKTTEAHAKTMAAKKQP
ncbi:MAG: hypothetical protein HQL86_05215, partial [Magnetococcales bacterium]|nr:hypothetical protein [Magnetococcales bacterium]